MRDARQLFEDSLALPPGDRARLARELLASLDEPPDSDSAELWVTEIEARAREFGAGQIVAEEWADLRRRLLARLASR